MDFLEIVKIFFGYIGVLCALLILFFSHKSLTILGLIVYFLSLNNIDTFFKHLHILAGTPLLTITGTFLLYLYIGFCKESMKDKDKNQEISEQLREAREREKEEEIQRYKHFHINNNLRR